MIAGLDPAVPEPGALVDELARHLRALLRDVVCGHLDDDLVAVADALLDPDLEVEPEPEADVEPDPEPDVDPEPDPPTGQLVFS